MIPPLASGLMRVMFSSFFSSVDKDFSIWCLITFTSFPVNFNDGISGALFFRMMWWDDRGGGRRSGGVGGVNVGLVGFITLCGN